MRENTFRALLNCAATPFELSRRCSVSAYLSRRLRSRPSGFLMAHLGERLKRDFAILKLFRLSGAGMDSVQGLWHRLPGRCGGSPAACPRGRQFSVFYCGGSNSTLAPGEFDDLCSSSMPPGGVSVGTSNDNAAVTVVPGPTIVSKVIVHRAAAGSGT